jgi:hypothetical protein
MGGRALLRTWFGGARTKWVVGAALLAVAGGATLLSLQKPAKAATIYYDLTYKAVTLARDGTKVPFTATGYAILDTDTGECSYFAEVPELSAEISGTGTLVIGAKKSYGLGSFNGADYSGTAIFVGKFNDDLTKFKGTIVVAIPDQFGPSPNGFTYTEGKITLILNPNPL